MSRELHLYGRDLQHNHALVPQPCQVVFCHEPPERVHDGDADQRVNVNANLDAIQFPALLHRMRAASHGATFPSLRVYDPLNEATRRHLAESGGFWCEWPPRI